MVKVPKRSKVKAKKASTAKKVLQRPFVIFVPCEIYVWCQLILFLMAFGQCLMVKIMNKFVGSSVTGLGYFLNGSFSASFSAF